MRDEDRAGEEAMPRAEVPPARAAALLGISRAQVHTLLDQGLLEYRIVGTEHRVSLASIEAYGESERARSRAAMHDLAALQNELGLTE